MKRVQLLICERTPKYPGGILHPQFRLVVFVLSQNQCLKPVPSPTSLSVLAASRSPLETLEKPIPDLLDSISQTDTVDHRDLRRVHRRTRLRLRLRQLVVR